MYTEDESRVRTSWHPDSDKGFYSFDFGVIEFDDNGEFVVPSQLQTVADCIMKTRSTCESGVVVVVFIHGWQQDAELGGKPDSHFASFREMLRSLMLRECERKVNPKRRVIGVFLGWRGKRWHGVTGALLNRFTFWDRFGVAKRIGQAAALRTTIREIVKATKGPLGEGVSGMECPLILMGHSMGALILESTFLTLLETEISSLAGEELRSSDRMARVTQEGRPISFPDLVILLNSAANATLAEETKRVLNDRGLAKQIVSDSLEYSLPLIVSFTAKADWVTGCLWRLASRCQKTEGHMSSIHTHSLVQESVSVMCTRKMTAYDFGQSWHCLRRPHTVDNSIASISIDLPLLANPRSDCHTRFTLRSNSVGDCKGPMWLFQVPKHISAKHSDIFNNRSSLFILALMQISGAVVSIATRWSEVFEAEEDNSGCP